MPDTIRIGCAVPEVRVGDVAENTRRICSLMEKAEQEQCRVLVFPELALTGYTCGDLFFHSLLTRAALDGLKQVAEKSGELPGLTVAVGLPLQLAGRLYNCAAVLRAGQVLGIVPKSYIPHHAPANEKRWFAPAETLGCAGVQPAQLGLPGTEEIPLGAGQLFDLPGGSRLGVEICEDLFAPLPPSTGMALRGAEVIVNLAASPETVGRQQYRRELVQSRAEACRCIYAFCSAGRTESTTDLVFSGHSIIACPGTSPVENGKIADTGYLLTGDADPEIIDALRCRDTSFRETADLSADKHACPGQGGSVTDGCPSGCKPYAWGERAGRELFEIQVAGLAQRLKLLGAKPVVGVSGGLDSTLALLVAAEAVRRLGWEKETVQGITMPCFGTTGRTRTNAHRLMELLGITALEIPIGQAVQTHFSNIGHDPQIRDTTYENVQARERTQILMDYAGRIGGIVVGTGDLSELALGWCTYNGDHMSMYAVNASILKSQIPDVIRAAVKTCFPETEQVTEDIIATPISPELLPGDQRTEELVGPYLLHDYFLCYHLQYGFPPEKLFAMACRDFAGIYDRAEIKKWLAVFYRRFFTQQFKRNCMSEGVRAGELSLNPRCDFVMAGDVYPSLWLDAVACLE